MIAQSAADCQRQASSSVSRSEGKEQPVFRIRSVVLLALVSTVLSGCVTREYDREGRLIERDLETELVRDSHGRIIGKPTMLVPPHTIVINGGKPTEREIRLLGVEGLPEREAPVTYAMTQEWMATYIGEEDQIFVRPGLGMNVRERVIYGVVYLYAYDERTGGVMPDGYVIVNLAMLSQGLVKIRDIREIDQAWLRERMLQAEEHARRNKLGLWSDRP
jgi:hypothetical protein